MTVLTVEFVTAKTDKATRNASANTQGIKAVIAVSTRAKVTTESETHVSDSTRQLVASEMIQVLLHMCATARPATGLVRIAI